MITNEVEVSAKVTEKIGHRYTQAIVIPNIIREEFAALTAIENMKHLLAGTRAPRSMKKVRLSFIALIA